jgi:2-polyprenyl-6-methoxyphenol hydroxylase-like FAD-dependent oxidoreductase
LGKDEFRQCIPTERFGKLGSVSVDLDMSKKTLTTKSFSTWRPWSLSILAQSILSEWAFDARASGQLPLPDLNIHWGSKVEKIDLDNDVLSLTLADESVYRPKLIVGSDGTNSIARKFLCLETAENIPYLYDSSESPSHVT